VAEPTPLFLEATTTLARPLDRFAGLPIIKAMADPVTRIGRLASSAALFVPSHVRWKIVAPYIVLTLMVAAAGTFIATRFVTGSLEDRFDNQLAEAARVASDSMVRQEREHLALVRSISFTIGVPESIAAKDTAALQRLVEPIAANDRLEYVEVLGLDGARLLGLKLSDPANLRYEQIGGPSNRDSLPIVQDVLSRSQDARGDKFAQLIGLPDGAAFYTGGPILDADGNLVGAVLVGTSIETLLPAIKHEALADVTFYGFDGSVLASTFARSGDDVDLAPRIGADEGLTGYREVKSVFERDFDLLYGELRLRDESVGLFSVALPSSFISNAGSTTRWSMTAVFGIATMAVIGTGLLIARGVTAPLLRLVSTAHAVTEGDLTARSGVKGRDEVGELATSFDVMTERLARQHLSTIRALTSAIDARDPYTAGHSVRVGQLSMEIGRELELAKRDLQFLEVGGYLHDIGKIGIRDNVLLKPGRLTDQERALIEEHPRIGINIVQYVDLADEVKQLVLSHHEKLDGSGYPEGLSGAQISIFARIGAVADIYDALTTERPYKPGLSVLEAVEFLRRESAGGHLDERVVQALIQVLPVWGRRLRTDVALKGFVLPELQELERDLTRAV
jgi:putative nucleotidyltransferase with HDIG domain